MEVSENISHFLEQSEQQTKLKAVFEEDEKQRELHRAEFKKQLDAILTPEQKAKMEENWQNAKINVSLKKVSHLLMILSVLKTTENNQKKPRVKTRFFMVIA